MVEIKSNKKRRFIGLREITKERYSILIAHLDREYEPDEKIEDKSIQKLETVLRFYDRESVERMITVLQDVSKEWKNV